MEMLWNFTKCVPRKWRRSCKAMEEAIMVDKEQWKSSLIYLGNQPCDG